MKSKSILIIIFLLGLALRLVFLNQYPAGLNADEAAIGYNAYSLLKTGHDEHGAFWPLVFRSFDDYKPPLYFYLVLPFVSVLGSVWAVRLPSAILGSLTVIVIYYLTNELFPESKQKSKLNLGHLAALLLAISPWHLHFSRGGWEVNVSTFFTTLGLLLLIKSLQNIKLLFYSLLSFVAAVYAYHSMRVIVPLLFLGFLFFFYRQIKSEINFKKTFKFIIVSFSLAILLGLPLVKQLLSKEGQSRFAGVSVFSDSGPLWEALSLRQQHPNSFLNKLIHNQYLTYSLRFSKNYLSHFSPRFLFIDGDEIARSKVPGMGQSYIILAPFLIIGLFFCLRRSTFPNKLLIFWFLISPLAAALTFQSPHALRAQNMVIPLTILTAVGLYQFIFNLRPTFLKIILVVAISTLLFYETASYLHQYYVHYPQELPYAWQYGFDQIADYVKNNEDKYDRIVISDRYDQPYILMAFFLKYPPEKFQKEIKLTPRDKFGFSTVRNFGKYEFRAINYDQDSKLKNTLLIAADEYLPEDKVIDTIKDPAGNPMYRFASTK